jgi:hypothetical protein
MTLRALIFGVLAGLALGSAVHAAEEDKDKDKPAAAGTIPMESVALPVVVDGEVLNYVFVNVRLELTPKADGAFVRTKEQYFRDDLVRAGHRTPFTLAADYNKVDDAKIKAEVMRYAAVVLGPGKVKAVDIIKEVAMKKLPPPRTQHAAAVEIVP